VSSLRRSLRRPCFVRDNDEASPQTGGNSPQRRGRRRSKRRLPENRGGERRDGIEHELKKRRGKEGDVFPHRRRGRSAEESRMYCREKDLACVSEKFGARTSRQSMSRTRKDGPGPQEKHLNRKGIGGPRWEKPCSARTGNIRGTVGEIRDQGGGYSRKSSLLRASDPAIKSRGNRAPAFGTLQLSLSYKSSGE